MEQARATARSPSISIPGLPGLCQVAVNLPIDRITASIVFSHVERPPGQVAVCRDVGGVRGLKAATRGAGSEKTPFSSPIYQIEARRPSASRSSQISPD
jgi:hypothetical protein